jgi:hypothetical protein
MDILNWLYLRKEQLIRKTANNADTDLLALGADVTFAKRDDRYKTYAMTLKDAIASGSAANTGYYSVDLALTSTLDVNTPKGIVEIIMDTTNNNPLPTFETAVPLTITNADMDFTNADNIYMQHSVYYNPTIADEFIPYVITTGVIAGANYAIFNASSIRQTSIRSATNTGGGTVIGAADTTYSFIQGTTSGSGQDAKFGITRDGAGAVSDVFVIDAGEDYAVGDTILITGNLIGGTTVADDLTITVASIWGENQFGGRFYLYYELYNI